MSPEDQVIADWRFEEAVQDYTVVIDLDPENDLEYFNRGIAYHYLELHEEVVKDLTRAVDLDPTNGLAKALLE